MIYTVTLNPSLDYFIHVKDFALGKTNRTTSEHMVAAGKGINVSLALKSLGMPSKTLGFIAGFTGEEIQNRLNIAGIFCDFICLARGQSRINVKLSDFEGTEINGMGPEIDSGSLEAFYRKLDALQAGDTLVLAGSVPNGLSNTFYSDILKRLSGRDIRFVVDAAGALLLNTLAFQPFLIKPNLQELEELFETKISDRKSAAIYAEKLKELGARNVLVSLGGDGAVLAAENGRTYLFEAPEGKVINAVGAGDAMVAGFLAASGTYADYLDRGKYAVAMGSASAFSKGFAEKHLVELLVKNINYKICGE